MPLLLDEKMDVKIEVQEDHILLVFPRPVDDVMVRWQDAWQLGSVIEQAANDIEKQYKVVNPIAEEIELAQLRINTHQDKYVVMIFNHTDRIRLSYEAARIVGRNIRMRAQDLDLLTRGVVMDYNAPGRKNRPTPFWEYTRKVFGPR